MPLVVDGKHVEQSMQYAFLFEVTVPSGFWNGHGLINGTIYDLCMLECCKINRNMKHLPEVICCGHSECVVAIMRSCMEESVRHIIFLWR